MSPHTSFYKWMTIGSLAAITVLFTHCGSPFSEKGDLVWDQEGVSVSLGGSSAASSLQAFERTMYPITRARCASCHSTAQQPLHASASTTTAHNAVINSYKVDFANIPNSRMVQKLREGHNCWGSCTSNAMEMQLAIEDWKDLMSTTSTTGSSSGGGTSTGGMPTPGAYTKSTANSMTLMLERQAVYNSAMPLVSQAAAATLIPGGGTITRVAGTPTYIHIPNANVNAVGGSDTVNAANFTFTSPNARNGGALWGLVNAKANDDSFNVKLNAGNFFTFDIADTLGQFVWQRLPGNHNFAAGMNTVRISNREDGAKIAAILFTASQTFNPGGEGLTAGAVTLRFSLNALGIAGGIAEIRVEDYDAYSYKLSQLRIISPSMPVRVKGVYVLQNGVYNPQNANLTQVDETVPQSAGGTVLTPSSMIVLKDRGESVDVFGLGFEILQ